VGATALRYLREQRHLTDATIRAAQLGYVPVDVLDPPDRWGLEGGAVTLKPGILIPHLVADHVWMLKIRRPTGSTPKYMQPRGGKTALYGVDQLAGRDVLVFTEGEFDCLLLRQMAGDLVDVVTLGSATAPLGGRWLTHLLPARRLLAAYDLDDAGAKGAPKLAAFSARVQVVRPVGANDLTDMVHGGGNLRAWVTYQLGPDTASQVNTPVSTTPQPAWDADGARAWLRLIVEDVGVLYRGLSVDAQATHRDLYEQLRGPLLLLIGAAFTAHDEPAYKAALATFDAAAQPIRAAAGGPHVH
jgi:hypothetical protein